MRRNYSYSWIKYYARSMCTTMHRETPKNMDKSVMKHRNKMSRSYPRRFTHMDQVTEEQRTLIIEHLLTKRNPANVLYSDYESQQTNNAYVSNLIIDMVYTTFCETGQGIALYDSQFEMQWKKFIVRKFSKIFTDHKQLTQLIDKLSVLPPYLSNYTQRIKYFILYEYDRISFRNPVYIYPCDAFVTSFVEYSKHDKFNNTSIKLDGKTNPYLRQNKMYKLTEQELYHRIRYLFEKNMYKHGLYLHEIASVFEQENGNVLSLKPSNVEKSNAMLFYQKGVEALALNKYFDSYYQSKYCFSVKPSLATLVENAGCLYTDNQHISRSIVFGNHVHGRYQNALLTILKNDDYLHTFEFIETKLKENYMDLYNELDFDRQNDVTFARYMLQRFAPLIHMYRVPTINRYNEDDEEGKQTRTEIQTDLFDLRYQRRYPHCLSVFRQEFNWKIYDLVRSECMNRMIKYDESDFVIGNNGVRLSEFENIWNTMFPNEIFPFFGNEYALFYHLIEYQSHNIRALPINNLTENDNEADKMYYSAYHFVPVQPYNNQIHSRFIDIQGVLKKEYRQNIDKNNSKVQREVGKLLDLKKEYTQNISYLLKTFRNDGIPLCDFARLFEFKYHNISNSNGFAPLLSFNPDIISLQIDSNRNLLHIGDIHKSLSNLLVVWGALITPKTKPIQQHLLFPLNLGTMNWMVLTCLDYVKHKNVEKGRNYCVPWNEVKDIGQKLNNSNSVIHKHRNKLFQRNIPDTKLWIMHDNASLKQHSFYKYASNITLTHKYIKSERDLATFWPNSDSNIMLFRRPIAPIMDYDILTLSTLYESKGEFKNKNKEFKNISFYKFIDGLMEKYSRRMKTNMTEKTMLYDYLCIMSMRIIYTLSLYMDESGPNAHYIRWSTWLNRYETLFGRLIIPSFNIDKSHNLIFAIFAHLHCNIIDFIGSKQYTQDYLIKNAHFKIPERHGMNQLIIQFPHNFKSKYISPMIAPHKQIQNMDMCIKMNKYHKEFAPISFLLSSKMLQIKKYNNLMMSADVNKMDTNWSKSDSFYALSMDPLTRNTVRDIMEDNTHTAADANEIFERLLSRKVYCIVTIKEILHNLSDDEWKEITNSNLRHIMDGFVVRGEVSNVYKILMIWFKDRLAERYELYQYLLFIYLNDNNVSMSYKIYEYLMHCLHDKYEHKDAIDDYYYESQMLIYCIAQCCNKLLSKIVENGQFYLFDEIINNIVNHRHIISNIDPFMSNSTLKLLLQTFHKNELNSRLLSLVLFIKQSSIHNQTLFITSNYLKDIMELLKSNHMIDITSTMIDIILNVNHHDTSVINWYKILKYCIQHQMVHNVLNNEAILNIYHELATQQGYSSIIQLDEHECIQMIDTYCDNTNKLNRSCWELIIKWITPCIANANHYKLLNNMLCYFMVDECLQCLLSQNKGDALKWINIAMYLVDAISDCDIYDMNGLIILLQMIATMKDIDLFCCILDKLSTSTHDMIMQNHFVDIIEAFIIDNATNLKQSNTSNTALHIVNIDNANYHNKLDHIIDLFKSHPHNQCLKGWIESTRKYQSLLHIDAVNKNTEFKQVLFDSFAST